MKRVLTLLVLVAGLMATLLVTGPAASAETAPNGYPYCANGSASDPDGDGWGWENSASCVVKGSRADPAATSSCPNGMACGSYTVSGLGYRKQQVLSNGADTLDLAVAMLETDNMGTNYAYGDNKSYDAANFGIFKQNWLMLRNSCSWFTGQNSGQWNNGSILNNDLGADVYCMNSSQSYYGLDRWFAGHRNGETGLNYPYTQDIANYKAAIYWIKNQIDSNSANRSNDTRFWVSVPAI